MKLELNQSFPDFFKNIISEIFQFHFPNVPHKVLELSSCYFAHNILQE